MKTHIPPAIWGESGTEWTREVVAEFLQPGMLGIENVVTPYLVTDFSVHSSVTNFIVL